MVAPLRLIANLGPRIVSITCLALLLASCQKSTPPPPKKPYFNQFSGANTLGGKPHCLKAPQRWWTFRSALGTGNTDVWNPQGGNYRLCLSVSGKTLQQYWKFSRASRMVQAFPHIDLPWSLPLNWEQSSESPITLSWQNHCNDGCRDDMGFDFWVSSSPHSAPFRVGDGMEVMILPDYRTFPPPASSYSGKISISGSGWNVYRFPVGDGWSLLQVISPPGINQLSLSPVSVLRSLAQNGWIPLNDRFVTVANLGTEIVAGSGAVKIQE